MSAESLLRERKRREAAYVDWARAEDKKKAEDATEYRLLEKGEQLKDGDQSLDDNCKTWSKISRIFVGHPYRPEFHVPHRRTVEGSES